MPSVIRVLGNELIDRVPMFDAPRMFVVKERREGRNIGRTAGTVICGVLECCLDEGVEALTALIEMWWLPRFHDMGWKVKPLGLPELVAGEWSVAVLMPIDQHTLASTRAFHRIDGPVRAKQGQQRVASRRVGS